MNEQVYKKIGRRYIPVGYSDGWQGFPTDGIWIVQTKPGYKSSECIMKLGEIESMQPVANLILGYKEKILDYIKYNTKNFIVVNGTYNEIVLDMLKEITK